jgi:hypothetical protein
MDVLVPTDVANDREASLCFHAGIVSAGATWDLKNAIDRKAFDAAMDSIKRDLSPNP